MNEDNVFVLGEKDNEKVRDNQSNTNNCKGHEQAMKAGGQGHYEDDGCNCPPTVSINQYNQQLFIIALLIILHKVWVAFIKPKIILWKVQ